MRWYDLEPSVCMAISLIEMADYETQQKCAEHIIESAKKNDPSLSFIKRFALNNVQNEYKKRWYDKYETISLAFNYLKGLPPDVQIKVAQELFDVIKEYSKDEK